MKGKKILWWMAFLILVGIFSFSAYRLLTTVKEYKQADDEYEDLEQYVTHSDDGKKEKVETSEEDPGPEIDFAALKAINEDVIGWIVVDALDISYPIMQGEDNDYYLHRTTEKTYNFAGSIFLDYENKSDFSDCNSIIYGHNMKNGSMFGTLKKFRNKETYQNSLYFWICTPEKNYRYQIFAAYETAVGSDTYTLYGQRGQEFIDYCSAMVKNSEIPTGTFTFDGKQRVVTLSTCTGNSATRFVVQGVCLNGENSAVSVQIPQEEEGLDESDRTTSEDY